MACSIESFPKNITITVPSSDLKDLFVQDFDLRNSNYDKVYIAPKSGYFENPTTNAIAHISDAFNQAKGMWKAACPCLGNLIDTLPLVVDNQYPEDGHHGRPFAFVNSDHPMVVNIEAHWIPKVRDNNLWPGVFFHEMSHVLEFCTSCFGDINKKIQQEKKDIHKIVQTSLNTIAKQCAADTKAKLIEMLDNYLLADPDFTDMSLKEQTRIRSNYAKIILQTFILDRLTDIISSPFAQDVEETRTYIRHFFCSSSSNLFAANYFLEGFRVGKARFFEKKNNLDEAKRKLFFENMDYGLELNAQGGYEKVSSFIDHFISTQSIIDELIIPMKKAFEDTLKGTIAEPSKVCDIGQYYDCPQGGDGGVGAISDVTISIDISYKATKQCDFGSGPVDCSWDITAAVDVLGGKDSSADGGCCKPEKPLPPVQNIWESPMLQKMFIGKIDLCLGCKEYCVYNFTYSDLVRDPKTGKVDPTGSFDQLISDTNVTTMLFGCPSGSHKKDTTRRFKLSDQIKTSIMLKLSSVLRGSGLGDFTTYLPDCKDAIKVYYSIVQ